VFGERFWPRGVVSLLGRADDPASVEAQIELLSRDEIIAAVPVSRISGEEEYCFRHALLRDAAYAALTPEDRILGHRLAGEWLEGRGEADAVVLAEHFERGAEGPAGLLRAADAWLRAGRTAAARGGPTEAVTHLERGIELLRGLPPSREEMSLLFGLGSVLATMKGYAAPEVEQLLARAGTLSHAIGLYAVHLCRQELPRARELARRALHMAEASESAVIQVEGLRPSWNCAYYGGDLPAARRHAER